MYTMPLLPLRTKKFSVPALAVLVLFLLWGAGGASAQRRRRPATSQQQAAANANTQAAQQKPQKKNITPLRSGDTADGSRITITSDAPLNDYSAYRSGDRYYVVIPDANAPRAAGSLRGKGFEDVQVQRRGNDAVLSFKLQPGTNARVQQRFNQLNVELTTPGGGRTPEVTPTPAIAKATPSPTPQTAASPTPQATAAGNTNAATAGGTQTGTTQTVNAGATGPTVVYTPTPEVTSSPAASAEASPAATPPAEQVAQVQQPTLTADPSTTAAPAAASPATLGTVLRQNWLVILIAALVLLSLVMIVAARSRAQRDGKGAAAPGKRRPTWKERRAAVKTTAELDT
ncbi:MAG TPA: hypothetical protein VJ715_15765, partial [Pyrinomonadaceae bacterium]|nr:hypothetical protein [Pyrinomonadaceae bacterium]